MKTNDTKTAITTEKESMTIYNWPEALKNTLEVINNQVLIDRSEYDRLLKCKFERDHDLDVIRQEFNHTRETMTKNYKFEIDAICSERNELRNKVAILTNEIEQLRKQIKKQNKRWTIF